VKNENLSRKKRKITDKRTNQEKEMGRQARKITAQGKKKAGKKSSAPHL